MLNRPPLYANNAGQYAVASAPPDSDSKYQSGPAGVPESKVKNKWYEIFDIGVETRTGSNQASYTSPLTAGSVQRIHTDSAPEFWLISILVGATPNAQLNIFTDADPVGYPIRIGNGGTARVPSRGRPFLTLRAVAQSIVGTVIAIGGYDAADLFMNAANQA